MKERTTGGIRKVATLAVLLEVLDVEAEARTTIEMFFRNMWIELSLTNGCHVVYMSSYCV